MIAGSLADRLRQYADLAALSYTERFEQTAHRFYCDTGLIAPGKDPGDSRQQDADRMNAWTAWQRAEGEQYRQDLRGVANLIERKDAAHQYVPDLGD